MINNEEQWMTVEISPLPPGWWATVLPEGDDRLWRMPCVALLREELRRPNDVVVRDTRVVFGVEDCGHVLSVAEVLGSSAQIEGPAHPENHV